MNLAAVAGFLIAISVGLTQPSEGDAPGPDGMLAPHVMGHSLLSLPVSFDVLEHKRLYVNGERITHVELTLSSGDTLYLNDTPVMPLNCSLPDPTPEEIDRFMRVRGNVPYVAEMISAGVTPQEARRRYYSAQSGIGFRAWLLYRAEREMGRRPAEACSLAFAQLPFWDAHGVVDWQGETMSSGTWIGIDWLDGRGGRTSFQLVDVAPHTLPPSNDPYAKEWRAAQLHRVLTLGAHPSWFVVAGCSVWTFEHPEQVALAAAQLDRYAGSGEYTAGPLPRYVVEQIVDVSAERGEVLPN